MRGLLLWRPATADARRPAFTYCRIRVRVLPAFHSGVPDSAANEQLTSKRIAWLSSLAGECDPVQNGVRNSRLSRSLNVYYSEANIVLLSELKRISIIYDIA